jgi:CRP-like cAMP-binding protein
MVMVVVMRMKYSCHQNKGRLSDWNKTNRKLDMLFFDLFRREPTIIYVRAGRLLFRQGDAPDDLMYVLVAGEAQVLVGSRVSEVLKPGTIVGELAMVSKESRSASVVAVTDCQFAEVNQKRFEFLVTEMPGFSVEVMRVMAGRLRWADRMLGECMEATA